ncbi:nucleoside diphosphate kinase homolog 7 isoform X6 [Panulirus ornatus]|uniref:nucleoside diphosphate kinase homolog 7 isoform X6 n=1 Tax=Panulirus ornatus TaxID=150431 RepID=UPI003A863EDA
MSNKIFIIALVVALAATFINTYLKNKGEMRYVFHTEWYDPVSATVKKFLLSFFPKDKSVEMLKITDYADATTREQISSKRQRPLLDYITSGPVVALELITADAVKRWRKTLGPTDSNIARLDAPETLRAKFGKDKQSNAAHGSDSEISATREIEFFFPSSKMNDVLVPQTTARLANNTCCIIKPHAVAAGKMGSILKAIKDEGYDISALQMFRMDKVQAEEFLEVYKGVVSEYPGMVQQLLSGPAVALEITSIHGTETPLKFREFVGPADPAVARELRPHSLRAWFGEDKVKNAVHCSDLPDDGPLEVEYFFKILQ